MKGTKNFNINHKAVRQLAVRVVNRTSIWPLNVPLSKVNKNNFLNFVNGTLGDFSFSFILVALSGILDSPCCWRKVLLHTQYSRLRLEIPTRGNLYLEKLLPQRSNI